MSALPYVKLYPSDFLAGASFLPPRQRGLYAYLLVMQADKGAITMQPMDLADYLGAAIEDVQSVLDTKFEHNPDINGWQNSRMKEERDRSLQAIENKRAGAAKARAAKENPPQTPPKKRKPEPEPASTTDIKVDIKRQSKGDFDPLVLDLPHGEPFRQAWKLWCDHRNELGGKHKLKPTSTSQQLKLLSGMSESRAVETIEHTVANSWVGLREPEPHRTRQNGASL